MAGSCSVIFKIDEKFKDRYKLLIAKHKVDAHIVQAALRATYFLVVQEASCGVSDTYNTLMDRCKEYNFDTTKTCIGSESIQKVSKQGNNDNLSEQGEGSSTAEGDIDGRCNTNA